jgi:FAD/FMN-containing dehydrogenase
MSVEALRTQVRGAVIQPGDESYESARKVYNAMIDKRRALIVRCVDVADVIATIEYARGNNLLTAIRGGGHNGGGLGTCDDGVVIDLSPMRGVRVDPVKRTVRVGAGCMWGDVDHATHPYGLAVPCGFIASTGDRDLLTVETSRGAEQTISTAKYEVTGRGGKGRELLQRGQFARVLWVTPDAPPPLA